jgi:hypothetical protein
VRALILVENLFWILRPIWTLWTGFCIRQAQFTEKLPQIIRMILNTEFLLDKMLNLL